MTEADLKTASDFIHEWINEEAKLHGSSHMRVVRDALAALIHQQREAALKEGLTLTVDALGFKEEPIDECDAYSLVGIAGSKTSDAISATRAEGGNP